MNNEVNKINDIQSDKEFNESEIECSSLEWFVLLTLERQCLWSLDRFVLYLWNGNVGRRGASTEFGFLERFVLQTLERQYRFSRFFGVGSLGSFGFASFLLTLKRKFRRTSSEFGLDFRVERSWIIFYKLKMQKQSHSKIPNPTWKKRVDINNNLIILKQVELMNNSGNQDICIRIEMVVQTLESITLNEIYKMDLYKLSQNRRAYKEKSYQ
ncbi:hypothetical protein C1645_873946 [Glomus cerebriforme]|uniref:Uncharacterized protein n=1 Tax=Glomus cerebriforme TaxID=658196 RepID=A0A397T8L3_9GLOM|nr:hypothetical protein C1645_873946 [Glomus cerebriforme]